MQTKRSPTQKYLVIAIDTNDQDEHYHFAYAASEKKAIEWYEQDYPGIHAFCAISLQDLKGFADELDGTTPKKIGEEMKNSREYNDIVRREHE